MAVPSSIKETVLMLSKKNIDLDIGATIVLFDTVRSEKLLTYDTLKRLITTQLRDADIIALSKVDGVPADAIERARDSVRHLNPDAEVVKLSARSGEGLTRLVAVVREVTVRT